MGKVIQEFETQYEKGDVVIFKKNGKLEVGIIEGYYVDNANFWFNIRISSAMVYTYTNQGDIGEFDIVGKVGGALKDDCMEIITR